jgi:hypothetical protein
MRKAALKRKERRRRRRRNFSPENFEVHLMKKLVKCMVLKTGHLGKLIRNNLKIFKWVLKRDGNDRLGR